MKSPFTHISADQFAEVITKELSSNLERVFIDNVKMYRDEGRIHFSHVVGGKVTNGTASYTKKFNYSKGYRVNLTYTLTNEYLTHHRVTEVQVKTSFDSDIESLDSLASEPRTKRFKQCVANIISDREQYYSQQKERELKSNLQKATADKFDAIKPDTARRSFDTFRDQGWEATATERGNMTLTFTGLTPEQVRDVLLAKENLK